MNQLTQRDKDRLISYINENDLDYESFDILDKFSISSADGMTFYPYIYNEEYILVKYDKRDFRYVCKDHVCTIYSKQKDQLILKNPST